MTRSQANTFTKYPKAIDGIKVPSSQTLKRYGLSFAEWYHILVSQNSQCFICERVPKSGILCIDHFHVKAWKKMKPDKRKLYVRGLLCTYCNYRLVNKGMTLERAERITKYLRNFKEVFQYRGTPIQGV